MNVTLICISDTMTVMGGPDGLYNRNARLTIGREYEIDGGMRGIMGTHHYRVKDDDGNVGEFPTYLFRARIGGLELSLGNWWHEIDNLMEKELLPIQLGLKLKSLVTATLEKTLPPDALDDVIEDAKVAFPSGFKLGDEYYDIAVYVPDDKEKSRQYFVLMPRLLAGTIKRIWEM